MIFTFCLSRICHFTWQNSYFLCQLWHSLYHNWIEGPRLCLQRGHVVSSLLLSSMKQEQQKILLQHAAACSIGSFVTVRQTGHFSMSVTNMAISDAAEMQLTQDSCSSMLLGRDPIFSISSFTPERRIGYNGPRFFLHKGQSGFCVWDSWLAQSTQKTWLQHDVA